MNVEERYHMVAMTAGSTFTTTGMSLGGFLCTVAGSLTVTSRLGTVLVNALPVLAGVYYPIPGLCGVDATVALTTAAGTLFKG